MEYNIKYTGKDKLFTLQVKKFGFWVNITKPMEYDCINRIYRSLMGLPRLKAKEEVVKGVLSNITE